MTVEIPVTFSAWSNISYRRTVDVDTGVDEDTWSEMTTGEREAIVDEMAREEMVGDIGWSFDV